MLRQPEGQPNSIGRRRTPAGASAPSTVAAPDIDRTAMRHGKVTMTRWC